MIRKKITYYSSVTNNDYPTMEDAIKAESEYETQEQVIELAKELHRLIVDCKRNIENLKAKYSFKSSELNKLNISSDAIKQVLNTFDDGKNYKNHGSKVKVRVRRHKSL